MGREKLAQPHQIHHQGKRKNVIIDQEGFQQDRRRKNTRRNIFESDQDMGQDNAWRGTTKNHQAHGAATQDDTRKGHQHRGWESVDPVCSIEEMVADKAIGSKTMFVQKVGSSAILMEGLQT